MAKKGVSKISGPTNPKVGEKAVYKVVEWYPATPLADRDPKKITWELFVKRENGKFTTANIKKKGIGEFTFNPKAVNFTYKVEGYLHRPEGKEPMATLVHPQKSTAPTPSKDKEILGITLTHPDGKSITKALSYMDKIKAIAKCQNMNGETIIFKLWEDDEDGTGHNAKNKYITKSKEEIVDSRGNARTEFTLFYTYIKLAQEKENDTKQHEYYVTVEYNGKHLASKNVNVNNPEHKNQPTQKPKPQPDSAKGSTNQNSKNNQPDKKGYISSVKILNEKKTPITKATFGDTIYVQIKGNNLNQKKYILKIWEDDIIGKNDLLYNNQHIFSTNTYQEVKVKLTDEFRKIGEIGNNPKSPDSGEYLTGNYQEIFAEVEFLTIATKSAIIEVSLKANTTPPEDNKSTANVDKQLEKQPDKQSEICECEAKVRAFIRMLRVKEGTSGERGYTTQYSGKQFTNMTKHPEEVITAGRYSSSAAGAYQIMADTWKNLNGNIKGEKKWIYEEKLDYAKKYNIKEFTQEAQDKYCITILKHNYINDRPEGFYKPKYYKDKDKKIRDYAKEEKVSNWRKRFRGKQGDIIQFIIDDKIEQAILLSSLCWASLPDSPYGQQSATYTNTMVKNIYDNYLKQELLKTDPELHLKKGFLKEFGYGCCKDVQKEEKESENKCTSNGSQCFEYADVWDNPIISNDNGGKNNNRFGYNSSRGHKGIDILSGPTYKDVHSIMCGKVVSIVDSFETNKYKSSSLGNTVMIKSKSKEGKDVFILYCHLDKIYVKKNDIIKHGQKIALSGSTGNASDGDLPNGVKGRGIKKENWHVHIEAATKGDGQNNFYYLGDYRIKAEDYMKTKFDKDGNAIK